MVDMDFDVRILKFLDIFFVCFKIFVMVNKVYLFGNGFECLSLVDSGIFIIRNYYYFIVELFDIFDIIMDCKWKIFSM